ncbi:unnamed protein product [Lasius platythorax]|uniref:Uncharacterized protein n=1 Tax=Lasius platythorax TaxID=488582 RepID=A0AAV2P9U4_9HYME
MNGITSEVTAVTTQLQAHVATATVWLAQLTPFLLPLYYPLATVCGCLRAIFCFLTNNPGTAVVGNREIPHVVID